MKTAIYNMTCNQGATFIRPFVFKDKETEVPHDFSGRIFRMQVRESYDSEETLMELSTTTGTILLDGPAGSVTLNAPATLTEKLPAIEAVYDVEMVNGPVVTRILQGSLSINPEVTR